MASSGIVAFRYILLDCDCRVNSCQCARYSGLDKGFLKVEVNIKLIEMSNLSTLCCAKAIVSKVDNHSNKFLCLLYAFNGNGSFFVCELLNGNNLRYIKSSC